ncbi:sporulation protein [Methanoplanus sp. FWC-SCC4]|uniref:Sporulation protein n=1 Tax=Methanochimaera problematica TaxID=2609417 RepID=A0AA97FDF1_9EURY|nr:spore germination protein GerW family protein [Methanoplanus sp. FWC-SCC4]WOF16914.1 sporulation protein [Methanoplanus sp. FWC-SCC4]
MNADILFEKALTEVDKLVNAGTVLGDPVEIGDIIAIPVASFGFGFGAGFGGSEQDGGAGAGAGGGVSPVAMIIVDKNLKGPEHIRVIPVRKPGPITEAINAVGNEILPKVMEVIKEKEETKKSEEENIQESK